MSMNFGAVLGLDDQLTSPLNAATRGLGKFDKQASLSAKAVGGIDVAIKGLVGGLGALAAIGKAFKLGGDLEETQNKFNVVFGEMAADTEKWTTQMATAWNKSELSIKTALATNQDMLTGFGATKQEAAELSKQFVVMATDLSSFANIPAADAMDRVTSAMLGNHEAVKALGIVLNETALEQTALNLGYRKSFRDMTPLEKMQVRYATAMEQSTNAIGDATNTAWSWVNVMKGMEAWATDTGAAIGIGLTSAFSGLARDALKALNVISIGQAEATSTGEKLEPVVRNTVKAFVAYKLAVMSAAVWQKRLVIQETLSNAVMMTKRGITIAVTTATVAYNAATIGATGITAAFTGGMAALNAVMFANPVVAVVAGVLALGTAVVVAYKKSEKFRNVLNGIWEIMKGISGIGAIFKGGEALFKFFTGNGEAPEITTQTGQVAQTAAQTRTTNNRSRNNNSNQTTVNVERNEFVVREEADIDKIAGEIARQVNQGTPGVKRR